MSWHTGSRWMQRRRRGLAPFVALARSLLLAAALSMTAMPVPAAPADYSLHYSPQRNPDADLVDARRRAAAEGKRVLIMVGGDWCVWCRIMDDYFKSHPDVYARLTAAFVPVKVYVGDENDNARFFARFPELTGVPHFFIVAPDGRLLGAQDTAALEAGRSYDSARFLAFIDRWRVARPPAP